ncbi:DUF2179 domain-containing protein [Alkalibacillus haloalkaliphilus]|uniref:DUF2179 domain-containing protein n=1 Tax=Alkalibacillus haloalkaliphilus TaxID=94136 RepID=UPI002935B0BC|nr:DUF2179 domain-containing protein [Alkalibacillus haloalkaliphilus]MDV2581705.1 DUF2179 domain-containing protein [Alkalibacillus haloalkaliphilus]
MLESGIIMLLIIFSVNIVYVSLLTVRMIFTLKGQKYIAASVGVFEITAYTLGLGLVLDNLENVQNLVAYALGFGLGVISGMKVEEKLAVGYITVNVISSDPSIPFTEALREKGYGVTSWYAYGMEGDRLAIQVLTPRKYELMLYEVIKDIDPKAFIVAYEPRQIHGGFWVKKVRGSRLKREEEKIQSE